MKSLCVCLCQVGDVARPIQPQVHSVIPVQPARRPYPSKPKPAAPTIPFLPTPVPHVPFDPYPAPPAPETPARLKPSLVPNPDPLNPTHPLASSESSESSQSSQSSESVAPVSSDALGHAFHYLPLYFPFQLPHTLRYAHVTSTPPYARVS